MSEKVLVALSGGVDSSVAAALLLEKGHQVTAAYMKNWTNAEGLPGECPWEEDLEDARAVTQHLGIEFRVIDLIDQYRSCVVDQLLSGYQRGITPNPDVLCNREMKFGVFLDYALGQGFDAVGTGHYARRRYDPIRKRALLLRGADTNKDQSYFLTLLSQHQLFHARFPVGELLKPQVREKARKCNLPTAEKKDSQGICFIGNIKMSDFLSHYVPDHPGEIIDLEGKRLGTHRGLHHYTLGQRRGHGIASPKENRSYVVVGKEVEGNRLILTYENKDGDRQNNPLYHTRIRVGELSFNTSLKSLSHIQHSDSPHHYDLLAQPRYRAKAEPSSTTYLAEDKILNTTFHRPQRSLTPGQICAYYHQGQLLGGGVIQDIIQ